MKKDYNTYQFSKKEWTITIGQGILLAIGIDYIFYESYWAMVVFLPIIILWIKQKRSNLLQKQKRNMQLQLKEVLVSLRISLQAGYSLENAIGQVHKDLLKLYKEEDPMVQEFAYMVRQIKVSVLVEQLLLDFAKRSHLEDLENFASVLVIAKRSGGDMAQIVESAARKLEGKIEVKREIEASVASKRMEQNIMSVVPCGIVLYMKLCSPGFIDALYRNLFGVIVMTGCLVLYACAYFLGKKIVDIEV